MIRSKQALLTVSGTTGTETISVISGRLLAVHLAFAASFGATADTTIKRVSDGAMPEETLLTITNSETSAWYYPRVLAHNSAGATVAGIYDTYPITGAISISVAQATDTKTLTVTLIYED